MAQVDKIDPPDFPLVEAVFSIGSNFGDRNAYVYEGLKWLANFLKDFKSSPLYASPDCFGSNREYINAVACGKTTSSVVDLEALCKTFETDCGRDAEMRRSGNVPVDIDLVIYDNEILRPNDYKREFFKMGYRMI